MTQVRTEGGLLLNLRRLGGDDVGYAVRSACLDLKRTPQYIGLGHGAFYRTVGEEVRASLLAAPEAIVLTPPDDLDLIVGLAWGDPSVPSLGYLHTRPAFRKQGVAKLLAALMDIRPGEPALVELATPDLLRARANDRFPIGLLRSTSWSLRLMSEPMTSADRADHEDDRT